MAEVVAYLRSLETSMVECCTKIVSLYNNNDVDNNNNYDNNNNNNSNNNNNKKCD